MSKHLTFFYLHPRKSTWKSNKMEVCKTIFLFKWVIFRFNVDFQERIHVLSGFNVRKLRLLKLLKILPRPRQPRPNNWIKHIPFGKGLRIP